MKKAKRKYTQRKKWIAAYESWQESGETQASYCKKEGLSLWQFKANIKALISNGDIQSRRKKSRSQGSGFIPIQTSGPDSLVTKPDTPYCTILTQDGGKVVIETKEGLSALKWIFSQ